MHSTERTCNGGTGWQLVYHTNALACLASFQVAPSATNHIYQTPPWTPATSILYHGLNDWHWCCINCRSVLQYITGVVVPATTQNHNAIRISGTPNPSQSLTTSQPNPQTLHSVNLKFHKYFLLYLYDSVNHRTMVWIWGYCHMLCNDKLNSPLTPFPIHYLQNAHINLL